MASVVEQNNSYAGRLLNLIYTDAFGQLGVELEIRSYPAARASVEADAGNVDGELARASDYAALHHNLLRVTEPTLSVSTVAYARDPHLVLTQGWDSLRGKSYRVEYRAGYVAIRQRLEAVVPAARLSTVVSAAQGLRKLAIGRIDLYVDNDEVIAPMLATPEFSEEGIRVAGVLEHVPIFAYLNRRHQNMALRLAAVLKKMRESGQIERYRVQAHEAEKTGTP